MNRIGSLNEHPLHAALKEFYARSGGCNEVGVQGYVIDVKNEQELIEIQLGNFSMIKSKLIQLITTYPVVLVYPIAVKKWLLKLPKNQEEKPVRRISPKRETEFNLFNELVSIPDLLNHPRFSIELVFIHEEEVRRYAGVNNWRQNGWVTEERRLIEVVGTKRFSDAKSLTRILPESLPEAFTTADLALMAAIPRWLSQKAVYCLRKMGTIQMVGKKGGSILYRRI